MFSSYFSSSPSEYFQRNSQKTRSMQFDSVRRSGLQTNPASGQESLKVERAAWLPGGRCRGGPPLGGCHPAPTAPTLAPKSESRVWRPLTASQSSILRWAQRAKPGEDRALFSGAQKLFGMLITLGEALVDMRRTLRVITPSKNASCSGWVAYRILATVAMVGNMT